ncbi:MAG: pseudouridine synthase [Bacteroidota bacterium]
MPRFFCLRMYFCGMNASEYFSILYEDVDFIAINKPTGILVHRTKISEDKRFVLQLLRRQIGYRIYPVHRLDRATSGVLIFGKHKEAASDLSELFRAKEVQKTYLGIVRGYVETAATVNYPLAKEKWLPKKEAITHYKKLAQTEISVPISRYSTARYSLVKVRLETGRRHQIRRHFSHLRHPIIGDKKHGDVKHNKHWANEFGVTRMLLHASSFEFIHPFTQDNIRITASLDVDFERAIALLFPDLSILPNLTN